jgi:transcription-repair coupling factor (superfamily II helicase)
MPKDCDLCGVTSLLTAEPHLKELADGLRRKGSARVYGLPSAAHVAVTAALGHALDVPVLLVTAYPDRALQLADELPAWLGARHQARLFPALDALPYDRAEPEHGLMQQRLAALRALGRAPEAGTGAGAPAPALPVVVAPARALLQPLMDPARFQGLSASYKVGQRFAIAAELARWERSGYRAVATVAAQGEYARRGGIVDVFPGDAAEPVRIELFGDEIDSLRRFDPESQRSTARVESLTVTAVRGHGPGASEDAVKALRALDDGAMLPHTREQWEDDLVALENGLLPAGAEVFAPYLDPDPASLIDYLPSRALILVDEPDACAEAMDDLFGQAREIRAELEGRGELPRGLRDALLAPDAIRAQLSASLRVELWTRGLPGALAGQGADLPLHDWGEGRVFAPALTYAGRLRNFLDDTLELRREAGRGGAPRRVVVASLQSARLAELYDERGESIAVAASIAAEPTRGTLSLAQGSLLEGWQAPALGLHVFGDAEVFGWSKPAPAARFKREATVNVGLDYKPGDYAVHIEHGIGRFDGVVKRVAGGVEREYLELQFAGTDKLFVPTDQLDRVTRYVGMGEGAPALSRLGTAEWTRAKARVKESVARIARELLDLYSFREKARGHVYAADGTWQREMEAAFPYEETRDQRRAILDVKRDMESAKPMDRLVCGDVGYGKTEVALRAAFKAVLDGVQVAILVPTTILAQQHYENFSRRMEAFPVRLAVLSRFQSRAQLKETVTRVAGGEIDIVVGTHRLLQKDVRFKNLGLVIIDEEQRFGVRHKEYLKQLRRQVDVLTLTATPIPRSLHMALVGVRDMSVIETPPEGRLPIRTYLQPFDEYHMREAILRELDRGGQVYVVHNKVQTIQAMAERLRRLVPEARIAIGHGQMPEDELEKVMEDFARKDYEILVCSSIIENGLDIPNVNTMIVNDAPNFGLAQLYQLRGRIGRGSVRAYAYLLYRRDARLTRTAEQRLRAIFESTELGAGFKIAMKDLEIRGAGNLLGPEQSGTMASVGFDLYSKLLAQAIGERKGEGPEQERAPVALSLPLAMYIPADYVEAESPRLDLYRRIAGMEDPDALAELDDEVRDRFGPTPEPVDNLLYFARIKALAARAGLIGLSLDDATLTVRGDEDTVFDRVALYNRFGGEARIVRGVLRVPRGKLGTEWRGTLTAILEETIAANKRAVPNREPSPALAGAVIK